MSATSPERPRVDPDDLPSSREEWQRLLDEVFPDGARASYASTAKGEAMVPGGPMHLLSSLTVVGMHPVHRSWPVIEALPFEAGQVLDTTIYPVSWTVLQYAPPSDVVRVQTDDPGLADAEESSPDWLISNGFTDEAFLRYVRSIQVEQRVRLLELHGLSPVSGTLGEREFYEHATALREVE